MSEIIVHNITFAYPETDKNVFDNASLSVDGGFTSLVGQNGTGKSTMMLLMGGRLQPSGGSVTVLDKNISAIQNEEKRNKLVSFVYQNMEFETDQPVGELFEYVYSSGNAKDSNPSFITDAVKAFNLQSSISKKMQHMSKGDIQKTIIIFSLLYGSPIIMMDEPVFALEENEKIRVMEFLKNYSSERKTSIYMSVHDLHLSRKYTDNVILFHKNGKIEYGPSSSLLTDAKLEEVYNIPAAMLYNKEDLYRKHLLEEYEVMKQQERELRE